MDIHGFCDPALNVVKEAFEENFLSRGDVGAACAIYRKGSPIVNLWAGTRDRHQAQPWQEDTLVNVFSASKGVLAGCIHRLVDENKLQLQARVCDYWPEFAANGKSAITVAMLLNHRAGLPAFHQAIDSEHIFDFKQMTRHLENEEPWWEPGTKQGYHVFTFGWLLGELLQRVTGLTVGQYLRSNVYDNYGFELHLGLQAEQIAQTADVAAIQLDSIKPQAKKPVDLPKVASVSDFVVADPVSLTALAFTNPPNLMTGTNSSRWRFSELPAAGMHCSASGLAQYYGALIGAPVGQSAPFISAQALGHCSDMSSEATDEVLLVPTRFSAGFMLASPQGGTYLGTGTKSFGHTGAGGSLGFGDPENELGFAYVTNRLADGVLSNKRAYKLVKALYSCI